MMYHANELTRLKYENAILAEENTCMQAVLDRVARLAIHMGRNALAQRALASELATIISGIDSAGNLVA